MMLTKKFEIDTRQRDPVGDDPKLKEMLVVQQQAEWTVTQRIREMKFTDHGEGSVQEEQDREPDWELVRISPQACCLVNR